MEEMETFLNQAPRPKVSVPRFRQALKRRLLASERFTGSTPWKTACVWTLTTEVALLGILVAFVANPSLPARLNQWIEPRTDVAGIVPEVRSTESSSVRRRAAGPGRDTDQRLVNNFLNRKYRSGSVKVRPLSGEEVVSIRRFKLDNGQQILVYTQEKDTSDDRFLPVLY